VRGWRAEQLFSAEEVVGVIGVARVEGELALAVAVGPLATVESLGRGAGDVEDGRGRSSRDACGSGDRR